MSVPFEVPVTMPLWLTKEVAARRPRPSGTRPIPAWICALPMFEKVLEQLTSYLKVPELNGVARWRAHKVALRERARPFGNAALAGLPSTAVLNLHRPGRLDS